MCKCSHPPPDYEVNMSYILYTCIVKCEEIDGHYPNQDRLKVAHSGFNIGFELNFWIKWCKLLHQKPSSPIQDAVRILNSDHDNFMKNHPKLRYTAGHLWLYLKADTNADCETLLEVGLYCLNNTCMLVYTCILYTQLVCSNVEENHLPAEVLVTMAYKKNEGRLFGGQFLDGISSAVDAISMIRYTHSCMPSII